MKTLAPYVIGLDIGTGSVKAVAVNTSGAAIYSTQVHYETFHPQPNFAEQNPDTIWRAFTEVLATVVGELETTPSCVSLSSCMHSLLLLDAENKPLTNLVTWADSRSAAIAEDLRNSTKGEAIYRATGTPIHSMSPLTKIRWFNQQLPDVFGKTRKFISIKEYIWHRLFQVFEVDYSVASATGLFDIHKLAWNSEALNFAGIDETKLSMPVATSSTRIYEASSNLFPFLNHVPFCIGASDGCLANLGVDALKPGVAAVTIGTSAAVRVSSNKPISVLSAMPFSYILTEQLFICGAPVNNGGNILGWLQKNFLNDSTLDLANILHRAEAIKPGSDGLLCLPYLQGERAPVWDERSSGCFVGIKSSHTQDHFLRAALEGVCYSLLSVIEVLESSGISITQLNVSGGFVRSEMWVQLLADCTGRPIHLLQTEDASSIGAALLGMKAIGLTKDYPFPPADKDQVIQPNEMKTVVYNEYFKVFKSLYRALKDSMHQLYSINP